MLYVMLYGLQKNEFSVQCYIIMIICQVLQCCCLKKYIYCEFLISLHQHFPFKINAVVQRAGEKTCVVD